MEFLNNSKNYSLNRKTYINLRWIAIIGQLIAINLAAFVFKYDFSFIKSNIVVLVGAISNIYLISFYVKNLLSNRTAFNYLIIDILLSLVIHPFDVFSIKFICFKSSFIWLTPAPLAA